MIEAELSRVSYYERVHLIKGVALSSLAAGIIAALVYVSCNSALSSSYKLKFQIIYSISLASLLVILGKKGFSDPLSRQEGCILSQYMHQGEKLYLPDAEGQFGRNGTRVSVPLLRFRRNLGYLTLLVFSLAALILTGGALALTKKSGFVNLPAPGLIGAGGGLLCFSILLAKEHRESIELRNPPGFAAPLVCRTVSEKEILEDLGLTSETVRQLKYYSEQYNSICENIHLNERSRTINPEGIQEEIEQHENQKVLSFEQYVRILTGEEYRSHALNPKEVKNIYTSLWDFFRYPNGISTQQATILFSQVKNQSSFNFMHFLRLTHETTQDSSVAHQINQSVFFQHLYMYTLEHGTFLELNCVFAVRGSLDHIHQISEEYQKRKNKECEQMGGVISIAYLSLPLALSSLCASYLLPDWDLLSEEDKAWITPLNPGKWDRLLSCSHKEINKTLLKATARAISSPS